VSPSEIIFDDREESGFYVLNNIVIDSITHAMRRYMSDHFPVDAATTVMVDSSTRTWTIICNTKDGKGLEWRDE